MGSTGHSKGLSHRWLWLLLSPVALYLAVPVGAAVDEDSRAAFTRAEAMRQQHDNRGARIEYMNAIAEDGNWAAPHVALAAVSLELFDPITARAELDRARALGARPDTINHLYGHAFWMEGKSDRAITLLTSGKIGLKYKGYANRILGRVYLDQNDIANAQKALEAALKLVPKDSMLWTEIGRLRFAIANQGGANEALDYAVKLDPNNIRALELRGQLVRSQFGLVAALPWFERGLQINPNDIPLLEEYGSTLGEAGRYQDMLAQARKLISLDSNNSRAFYMQAVIAARAGNPELARRLMARVSAPFGELPGPRLLLAVSEYEMGNFNQAVDILEQLVDAQPYNLQLRILLARAMHRAGDQSGAWDVIKPVAVRSDADSYALSLAGHIAEAMDEQATAMAMLNRSAFAGRTAAAILPEPAPAAAVADDARRNPQNARKVIPQIRLLLARGDVGSARSAVAGLLTGSQGVADAHILSGDIEMAGGNTKSAIAAYERARSISFSTPVMLRLVDAYRKAGQGDTARKLLADYIAFNPSSLSAIRLVAYDHLDNRRWKQALSGLLGVRARIGYNDAVLNANLARAYSGEGQHDAALREAALAYRISPGNPLVSFVFGEVILAAKQSVARARSLLRKANKLAPDDTNIRKAYVKLLDKTPAKKVGKAP